MESFRSLAMYFGVREEELGVLTSVEQRVQTLAQRYRIPDVCLLRGDAAFEEIVTIAPLLCIEVLSPEDRMREMYEKIEDYLAMGVKGVWVIDPKRRKMWQTDERGVLQPIGDELALVGTAVRLAAVDLFRQLNKLEGLAG